MTETDDERAVPTREPPTARQERKLLREAQRGSPEALTALYTAHWRSAHLAWSPDSGRVLIGWPDADQ